MEDPPQGLSGRQGPVSLQLGANRSPVDRYDPILSHSGNGILSDCHLKRARGIDYATPRPLAWRRKRGIRQL
jgi:hypothetical protein